MKVIKLKIDSQTGRDNLILILANHHYKTWLEERLIFGSPETDFLVCFEYEEPKC